MPVLMKALRSFRGDPGEGVDRYVDAGSEFYVQTDHRADALERGGLAVPASIVPQPSVNLAEASNFQPPPENKAVHEGPLASRGGEIGVENAPSLSRPAHQPRARRSKKREAGLDL